MKYQDVIRILDLIDGAPGSDIALETGELSVTLVRGEGRKRPTERPTAQTAAALGSAETPQQKVADSGHGTPVAAPMGGMFYAASAPGQPPFATVGQTVKKGDQLGIVEVMKLFTPITAPTSGTLAAILIEDQTTVAKDDVLMRIEGV